MLASIVIRTRNVARRLGEMDSPLRSIDRCIFCTHNGSNTVDAVIRASHEAIDRLAGFLAGR